LSGVTFGDTIQYFVVAQDLSETPVVSINSGVFASQPMSVALTTEAFPIGDVINSYELIDTSISFDVAVTGYSVGTWFETSSNQNSLESSFGMIAPKALIQNSGDSNIIVPFSITFIISGAKNYSSVIYDTISAGNMKAVTFDSTFVPDSTGECSVLIYTSLSGDQNQSNDTLVSSFSINQNRNFGYLDGYYFANSTLGGSLSATQPEFCWKDTTGSVDLANSTMNMYPEIFTGNLDNGYWKVVLPASKKVRFFGVNYDTIRIGTDGIISFRDYDPLNESSGFPQGGIPGGNIRNAFYPLWWDQDWGVINSSVSSNRLSYKISGNQLLVTFDKASQSAGLPGEFISYQVCIEISATPTVNSRLLVQYADAENNRTGNLFLSNYQNGSIESHIVGMQNVSGTSGIQYRYLIPEQQNPSEGPLFDTLSSSLALQFGPNDSELNSSCQELNLAFRLEAIELTRKDTVTVMLRRSVVPYAVIEKKNVVYDSVSGSASVQFTLAENNSSYYITVGHRNSITTWSSVPAVCNANAMSYDFTTGVSKAFNNNMVMTEGKASFFSGDVIKNFFIDGADMIKIYNENVSFERGNYLNSDLNYDGIVDITDMIYVYNNNLNFVSEKAPPGAIEP
jgi:hypothetical protein